MEGQGQDRTDKEIQDSRQEPAVVKNDVEEQVETLDLDEEYQVTQSGEDGKRFEFDGMWATLRSTQSKSMRRYITKKRNISGKLSDSSNKQGIKDTVEVMAKVLIVDWGSMGKNGVMNFRGKPVDNSYKDKVKVLTALAVLRDKIYGICNTFSNFKDDDGDDVLD